MVLGDYTDPNYDPTQDPNNQPPQPAAPPPAATPPAGQQSGYVIPDPKNPGQFISGGYLDVPSGGWTIGPNGEVTNLPPGYEWNNSIAGIVKSSPAASGAPGGTTTPPPGAAGAGTGSGSLIQPFTQPFTAPTPAPLPNAPGYVGAPGLTLPGGAQVGGGSPFSIAAPPELGALPKFAAPTLDEAMNDPGYQFGEQQGATELKNWEAAHGTFNDSSSAQALTDYGRNAAQTQYGNVWNRAYNAYNTNLNSQYITPWQASYQNWASGTLNPTMAAYGAATGAAQQQNSLANSQYDTQSADTLHQNDMNWQNAWNGWLQNWNIFRDQRDSTFNKQFSTATA